MGFTITHSKVTGGAVDTRYSVDLHDWDAAHSISGSVTAAEVTGGAALSKVDDTNVTLTLGGSPGSALLAATSITVGWTGSLAATRGGTGTATYAQGDILYASATNTLAKLAKNTSATRYLSNTGASNNPAWAPAPMSPPQGRVTLTSGTPIMIATASAQTTVYYTPCIGNLIPIYDGTDMVMTAFAELSQATTDTTKSPAAVANDSIYDLFVWNDAGTMRCTRGPAWTNSTTRSAGTALVMVQGIYLNNASITNGPAAQRGTYVGTIASNGSSSIDWIYAGIAAGGTAGRFCVWNAHNHQWFGSMVGDSTDSWTYAVAAWRQANAQANMKITILRGLNEDIARATFNTLGQGSAAGGAAAGIGIDSTTAFSGSPAITAASQFGSMTAVYSGLPGAGLHVFYPLEYSRGAGTATFYGDIGDATTYQSGLIVEFEA